MVNDAQEPTELIGNIIGRIKPFVPNEVGTLPDTVTGSLAELLSWWINRIPQGEPRFINTIIDTAGCSDVGCSYLELGVLAADKAVDSGTTVITLVSNTNSTPTNARAIIGLLTHKDAYAVYSQGPGITDIQAMTQIADIRDTMRMNLEDRGNPLKLARLDPCVEYTVGLLLGASARSTPVILGTATHLAAALIAQRVAMPAWNWWRYGSTSPDTGVQFAIDRIGIPSGLPLNLSDDTGTGARVSAQLLEDLVTGTL